jgi:hypothetical protein
MEPFKRSSRKWVPGEVNQRLYRMDATLVTASSSPPVRGPSPGSTDGWAADADYVRVLAELSKLKHRVAKLERPEAAQ